MDRLLREFRVDANVGRPQVAYKETIRRPAATEGRFVRQSGGRGQYGHVKLQLEPNEPGEGIEFEVKVRGGSVPREYFKAVEQGVRDALQTGALAGFPVVDIRVRLVDGSSHDVDSSEIAFRIAGSLAFKDAMSKAGATLLEPIMKVEISTSEEFMGPVSARV